MRGSEKQRLFRPGSPAPCDFCLANLGIVELGLATCPFCRHGSLRIIATITQEAVITRILRHLKLAAVPPPIAPARSRQETFDRVA